MIMEMISQFKSFSPLFTPPPPHPRTQLQNLYLAVYNLKHLRFMNVERIVLFNVYMTLSCYPCCIPALWTLHADTDTVALS